MGRGGSYEWGDVHPLTLQAKLMSDVNWCECPKDSKVPTVNSSLYRNPGFLVEMYWICWFQLYPLVN